MAEFDCCPVCENKDYFSVHATSTDGMVSLISCGIGRVDLLVCSNCGCVYVAKDELKIYQELKEKRNGRKKNVCKNNNR